MEQNESAKREKEVGGAAPTLAVKRKLCLWSEWANDEKRPKQNVGSPEQDESGDVEGVGDRARMMPSELVEDVADACRDRNENSGDNESSGLNSGERCHQAIGLFGFRSSGHA